MRVLLTGSTGQLGSRLRELAPWPIVATHHAGSTALPGSVPLDFGDAAAAARVVRDAGVDWIVHAAAMTNVDGCEKDPALAWRVNAEGTRALADAAAAVGARMLYVSTDYVFDGERGHYQETDEVGPISEYGRSKLGGETLAREAMPNVTIARTSVVFGPHKKNFVIWLVDELRAGRPVRIVEDQFVTPTLTRDLAEQIIALVGANVEGIFHTAGATSLSRLDAANGIAREFGLDSALITPIKTTDLQWVAKRPRDSTLDTAKVFKYKRPLPFDAALRALRDELAARQAGSGAA